MVLCCATGCYRSPPDSSGGARPSLSSAAHPTHASDLIQRHDPTSMPSRARRGRRRCGAGLAKCAVHRAGRQRYGQLGCYGSPIATPNFDAPAAGGLLYSNMHTTALRSSSRSCIITGRNHHANATAAINEMATGYPGYNGSIPFENGFLSEMLLAHGYSTYMVGKYHLLPPGSSRLPGR
jgi:Sulfatase